MSTFVDTLAGGDPQVIGYGASNKYRRGIGMVRAVVDGLEPEQVPQGRLRGLALKTEGQDGILD